MWLAQDERQRKQEEENDVTKQADELGMANRINVALGGVGETEVSKSVPPMDVKTKGAACAQSRGNQETRKYMPNLTAGREGSADLVVTDPIEHATQSSNDTDYKKRDKDTLRDQKVKEALERYRIRKGLLAQSIGSLERSPV